MPITSFPTALNNNSYAPFELPVGARYVYKALGFDVPTTQEELDDAAFPPEAFADELELAGTLLATQYRRSEFPCLYNSAGTLEPTGADARLYDAALGYYAASLIVSGQSAAPGVGGPVLTKRQLEDITYTFKDTPAEDRAGGWKSLAIQFMEAMSCVGGDDSAVRGFLSGGLLQGANPNTNEYGQLTTNAGVPLETGLLSVLRLR